MLKQGAHHLHGRQMYRPAAAAAACMLLPAAAAPSKHTHHAQNSPTLLLQAAGLAETIANFNGTIFAPTNEVTGLAGWLG